ncbi:hypothetical protein CesoFtcFv8_025276 [Champsocephalus esox]|uniref:Uncharacterized protein n=1 Tax=Champsocephalus esox TaxID=159716 RepID=A0AAN8B3Z9_9TELE|nr:hypothetical protein CesoFtcFv8_025276 [Champsocephalus esox]
MFYVPLRTKSRCVRQIPTTRRGSDLKEETVDQLTEKTCWRGIWDSAPILLLSPEAAGSYTCPEDVSTSGVIWEELIGTQRFPKKRSCTRG